MTQYLHVQDLLRGGMTAEQLLAAHAVHMKPHNGKVSFVYDQLEASGHDPVANQCRGLVLREGTWEVLAYPFNRFFNHGQVEAAPVDLNQAAFHEKLDGTLIIAYWDDEWKIATRSMCEAHGPGNFGYTFRELADKAAADMGRGSVADLLAGAPRDRTLMFELTAPENQVVCAYDSRTLTLLGVRHRETFQEETPDALANLLGVPVPKRWQFDNFEHIAEVIREWNPTQYEGIVVCDHEFRRVKVKSPKYLAVHHATDSLGASWRSVMEAVATGAADDIEAHVPAFVAERIERCRAELHKLIAETEADLRSLDGIDDMKAFAERATKTRFPAALFSVKRKKATSISEYTLQFNPEKLVELCGIGNEAAE